MQGCSIPKAVLFYLGLYSLAEGERLIDSCLVRTAGDIGCNIKSKLLCFAVKRKAGQKLKSRGSHSRGIPASPWRIQFPSRKRYYLGALKGSPGSEITRLKCQGLDYFYGNLQQVSSELSSHTRRTPKRNPYRVTLLLHLRH
jgi:hypothetical protein